MAICDWPEMQRPREKLLKEGVETLSDAELLAIFLRTGVRGKSAIDLANTVLVSFGSLRQLLGASLEQFCETKGLGTVKYVQLQAVMEIARRYMQETLIKGKTLTSSREVADYFVAKLRHLHYEVFACLWLDTQYRIIRFEELFRGCIDSSTVYPGEVVKSGLKHNAKAVVIAHNHPSGSAVPSQADKHITAMLKRALALVDMQLLDHIIVGDKAVASLAELGELSPG